MILSEVSCRWFLAVADFCIKLQFSLTICFRFRTAGWYVVTKGSILSWFFFLCLSADCLKAKLTSDIDLSMTFFGYPRALRRILKLQRHSSNVVWWWGSETRKFGLSTELIM